jgi:outer membrane protein assembly factor BamB
MTASTLIFVGIHGSVAALEPSTGTLIWKTRLKGSDFVNVIRTENELYAATKGEVYCLDPATGQVRWNNPLRGLGLGLVCMAVPGAQPNQAAVGEKRRREQAAAAAAAVGAAHGAS